MSSIIQNNFSSNEVSNSIQVYLEQGYFECTLTNGKKIVCYTEDIDQENAISIARPGDYLILSGNMQMGADIKVTGASILALNNTMITEGDIILTSTEGPIYTLACPIKARNLRVLAFSDAVIIGEVSARILAIKDNLKIVLRNQDIELFKKTLLELIDITPLPEKNQITHVAPSLLE